MVKIKLARGLVRLYLSLTGAVAVYCTFEIIYCVNKKAMKNNNVLGLDKDFQKVFAEMGFDETTEIQEKVIPLAVAGKDLIAKSATGSGKTLAFGFPIIEKLKIKGGLQ